MNLEATTEIPPCRLREFEQKVILGFGVLSNKGSIVIQAITGKKTMGTVSPGNSLGKVWKVAK